MFGQRCWRNLAFTVITFTKYLKEPAHDLKAFGVCIHICIDHLTHCKMWPIPYWPPSLSLHLLTGTQFRMSAWDLRSIFFFFKFCPNLKSNPWSPGSQVTTLYLSSWKVMWQLFRFTILTIYLLGKSVRQLYIYPLGKSGDKL